MSRFMLLAVGVLVTVTAYSSDVEQCDGDPFVTASGERVRPGGVALSRDMLARWGGEIEYGDSVVLEFGDGRLWIMEVLDTMAARWERRVDVWCATKGEALRFGKVEDVVMWKVEGPCETE